MRNIFTYVLTIFCLSSIFGIYLKAQTYKPLDTADYVARKEFLKKNQMLSEAYVGVLKTKFSGKFERDLEENYLEYQKDFVTGVKNRDYTFQPDFQNFFNKIIQKLAKDNPNIPKNISVLVSKENTPNAMCAADGVFVVHMGLFNWLDNEDQMASVLGHELGHRILEHSLKWYQRHQNTIKNNQAELRSLKNQKTNVQGTAFNLFKDTVYKGSEERRRNERQADSIGYVIFGKTNYQKGAYISALKNIEEYDSISPKKVSQDTYKKYFSFPNAPFKEKWLKMEDFSQYNYNQYKEKLNKDSLSSHPEVSARISILEKNFPDLKGSKEDKPIATEEYTKLRHIARMEIVPNFFQCENYGLGIYSCLQFLQDGEEVEYYEKWLGKLFEKVLQARKEYRLNRYLDRIDPKEQSESYQQFLSFMWNLSLEDLESITSYYKNKKS